MARQRQSVNAKSRPTWIIQLPFTLSPGKTISLLEADHRSKIGEWHCCLSGGESSYFLKVFGLPDRKSAEKFVQQMGSGLLWARVATHTGIHFDLNLDKVTYCEDPEAAARNIFGPDTTRRVDCVIDSARTAIFPSDKEIATITAGAVNVLQAMPPDRFVSAVAEGTYLPHASQVVESERIRLASDLYSHSHFEASVKARFLGQMTALEVLAERPERAEGVQALIDKWVAEVSERQRDSVDENEKKSLERLKSRVHGLKEESITESVRLFVVKALNTTMDPKATELVAEVGPLYAVRSKIAHGRPVVLGQAPTKLQELVGKALRAVMERPSLLTESQTDEQP